MEFYAAFGIVAPRFLAKRALRSFARFNDPLPLELKRRKSKASPLLEFLGLAVGFRDDDGDVIAGLAPSKEISRSS